MNRIITKISLIIWLLHFASHPAYSEPLLKEVFANDFMIGAALNRAQYYGDDLRAAPIIKNHFNTVSPENALKWEMIHPESDRYFFTDADRYVEFGEKNGHFIIGHVLVWHNQTPKKVFEDNRGNPVSRAVLLNRMRKHISTVVGRYKGRIRAWDVVNEALNEDGTLRQSSWLKIIGEDYIAKAFEYAHQADPDAELYYNDYSIENEPKRKGAVKLIRKLIKEGVPISGIGLQGHNNLTFPTLKQQADTIKEFAELGLKVAISELDVSVLPDPKGFDGEEVAVSFENREQLDPYRNGLPSGVEAELANRYAGLFGVYLNYRKAITRITFWNVTDGESWLNNYPIRGRTNYPLLFDRSGKTKSAFDAVILSARKSEG